MTGTETIALPRREAAALAELLRTLETVLDMEEVAIADALDTHFGYSGAVDILFAAAGLHAEMLHSLLTAPTEPSRKTETTR